MYDNGINLYSISSGWGEIPLPAVTVRERKLIRCNSVTDSTVWMREEARFFMRQQALKKYFRAFYNLGVRGSGKGENMTQRSVASRRLLLIVTAGVLAAISTILRFLEIPLPLLPSFLKLDFSNVPALIGGLALGPVAGTAILLVKNLIYLPFSQTLGVGEFADFIISLALVLTAALFYKHNKSRKGAIIGMTTGSAIMSFVAGPLMNYFVLIPFYAAVYFGSSVDAIIQLSAAANPAINSLWAYILYAVVPFNIVKCLAVCLITGLLYKPLSPLLHKYR
jgi:riboflavin transporter FmnP